MATQVETYFSFEAAHRLYDTETYSEECRNNLHGHSYVVRVVVSSSNLNNAGMVIDFKLLKKILKETIEDKYDHSCILRSCDPLAKVVKENCKKVHIVEENPTAEWMAKKFYNEILYALASYPIDVEKVSVQETEHNIATFTG